LDPKRAGPLAGVIESLRYLERVVTTAPGTIGIVLRYGGLYGPGTSMSLRPPGSHSEMVRKRWFAIIGNGAGIWSFIHIEDATRGAESITPGTMSPSPCTTGYLNTPPPSVPSRPSGCHNGSDDSRRETLPSP